MSISKACHNSCITPNYTGKQGAQPAVKRLNTTGVVLGLKTLHYEYVEVGLGAARLNSMKSLSAKFCCRHYGRFTRQHPVICRHNLQESV